MVARRCPGSTLFEDEGLSLAKPENRLRSAATAARFLATHLGGRCEP